MPTEPTVGPFRPGMRTMDRETDLVISLCRTPLASAACDRISAALAGSPDWATIFRLAAKWEVEPVVFSNLRLHFSEAIPEAVRANADEREQESRALALTRGIVLVDVATQMERSGVPVVALKGPALGIAAYGDASMRTFADVDLLVRRQHLRAAKNILVSRGYAPAYTSGAEAALVRNRHALEFSGPRAKVELHWSLLSRHLRWDIDTGDIWKCATTVSLAGSDIKVLAPHHLFLFVCAHGAKHEWERMRWVCDVAQLADRLGDDDVAAVLALAERTHSRRLLALGLRVARDVLGDASPAFPAGVLVPERDTAALAAAAVIRLGLRGDAPCPANHWLTRLDPRLRTLVFWTEARERRLDRIACLAEVLFVPTENDERSGPFRWVSRPLRLAAKAVRRATAA